MTSSQPVAPTTDSVNVRNTPTNTNASAVVKANLKVNEEKKEDDGVFSTPTKVSEDKEGGEVVEARSSLVKVLMTHRFKDRFSSTALNLDSSLSSFAATSGALESVMEADPKEPNMMHQRKVTNDSGLVVLDASNSFTSMSSTEVPPPQTNTEDRPVSITPEEREYLEQLILKGDVATLESARDKLEDTALFPKDVRVDVQQPSKDCQKPPKPPSGSSSNTSDASSSNNPKEPIKRRDSKVQQQLYKIHQEKSLPPSQVLRYLKQSKEQNSLLQSSEELGAQGAPDLVEETQQPTQEQKNRFRSQAMQFQSSSLQNSILLSASAEDDFGTADNRATSPAEAPANTETAGGKFKSRVMQFPSQPQNSILMSSSTDGDEDAVEAGKAPSESKTSKRPNMYSSPAMQFQSTSANMHNSILQTASTDADGTEGAGATAAKAAKASAKISPTGSWNPMEDSSDFLAPAEEATNSAEEKQDGEELEPNESFVEMDPFKDISSWIDGGQGVEVNDSGIPLIGRSSSSASSHKRLNQSSSNPAATACHSDSDLDAAIAHQLPSRPFRILGTSADDVSCHPHVLSPPLMESLLSFMPESLTDSNYWLKYSLVRDGANLWTMLRQIRASTDTLLAIETVDGNVFGAFVNHSWRFSVGWYGGQQQQAFLWKMRRSRLETTSSIYEQAIQESEVQVYPVRPGNVAVQYCSKECLMLGRGEIQNHAQALLHGKHYGHGIYLDPSLLRGTTSSSETFGNPCLVDAAERGARFEVANIEVWTFTPHDNVNQAQQSELSNLFLEGGREEKDLNLLGILVGGSI